MDEQLDLSKENVSPNEKKTLQITYGMAWKTVCLSHSWTNSHLRYSTAGRLQSLSQGTEWAVPFVLWQGSTIAPFKGYPDFVIRKDGYNESYHSYHMYHNVFMSSIIYYYYLIF